MVAKCLQQPYNWVYEKWATLPLKPSFLIQRLIQIATKVFFALALVFTYPCHLFGRCIMREAPVVNDPPPRDVPFPADRPLPMHLPACTFVPHLDEQGKFILEH